MQKQEKSILLIMYVAILLMFSMLSLDNNKINYFPMIMGVCSCIIMAYGHFIIKKFYPDGDKYLFIIASFIAQFGLVIIYRLDLAKINSKIIKANSLWSMWSWKQLSWFVMGMAVFILMVVFLPDIKKLAKFKIVYIVAALLLLCLPLAIGAEIKGSRNWIRLGGFSMQPSEIAKLFLVFYLAAAFQDVKNIKGIIKTTIPVIIAIGLLVIQKDLGAALIFFGIFITMLFIGTSSLKDILLSTVFFSGGGILSYFAFSHVRKRFDIWHELWKYFILNTTPESQAVKDNIMYLKTDKAYQVVQSLIAISAGSLFGSGIGLGHPDIIPEAHNDFIFSAICEEMGLLGAMALILFFLMLVYRGLRTSIYAKDDYSRLVAVGISSMIAFQVFVIIGGVTNMIPLTGITLPFVSYGGSSMIINFAALGVLQKISESGSDLIG